MIALPGSRCCQYITSMLAPILNYLRLSRRVTWSLLLAYPPSRWDQMHNGQSASPLVHMCTCLQPAQSQVHMPVHLSSTCSTCTTIIQPCFAHCRERGAVADVPKPYFVRKLRRREMFGIVLEGDQCLATKGRCRLSPHLLVEVGWGPRCPSEVQVRVNAE